MIKSKKKNSIFLIAGLLFCICLNAQSKSALSGRIIDSSSNNLVNYATITLATLAGKVLNGTTSDSTGYFKLSDIDTGFIIFLLNSPVIKKKF